MEISVASCIQFKYRGNRLELEQMETDGTSRIYRVNSKRIVNKM